MNDDFSDPFRRRDTRSFLGKTERRESPRVTVQSEIRFTDAKIAAVGPLDVSVSLNGVFVENKDSDGDATEWIGHEGEITLHLPRPDESPELVQISGTFERPHHRNDGALIRFDELSFESERSLARFLDEKTNP